MLLVQDLSKAQLAFQIAGGEIDQFSVIRYRGTEGLCQLYRFEIELEMTFGAADFETIIGAAAVLSINTERGERWFHGVISRFELIDQTADQMFFRAELVPTLWRLTHRYGSRIFQNKTTPDIIRDTLSRAGIVVDRFRMDLLERTYQPREYCVQYRETDFSFIARLMEDEGIWWYFEQSQDAHVLVLADSPNGYKPIEGNPALPFRQPSGMNTSAYVNNSSESAVEHVFRFRLAGSMRADRVLLNDFDFKNPRLDLRAASDGGRKAGEFADYPGRYELQQRGNELAELRREEFEAGAVKGNGRSHSYRLMPGRTFELTEHGSADGGYMITSITHQGKQAVTRTTSGNDGRASALGGRLHQALITANGSQDADIKALAAALLQISSRLGVQDATNTRERATWLYRGGEVAQDLAGIAAALGGNPTDALTIANLLSDRPGNALVDFDAPVYECTFECIPANVSYRPPRVTPWPKVGGSQTARVVGPEQEEIYVDEYGRVKVHFEWDREGQHRDHDSCWIRVCQGMAGGNYGMMFIPRVGQEVVVDFLNGNPDQPIIVGRVYNADQMPPYELPKEKTKSCIKTHTSKGGGGCNEIRFEDAKGSEQLLVQATAQMDTQVGGSHMHTIGNQYHVKTGGDWVELVKGHKSVGIKGLYACEVGATESRTVRGDQLTKVDGSLKTISAADAKDECRANYLRKVAGGYACQASSILQTTSNGIELVCGGSSIVINAGGIYIEAPSVYINSGRGPSVPRFSLAVVGNRLPGEPVEADSAPPGHDTRYDGGETPVPGETPVDIPGHDFDNDDPDDTETTFIDIALVDKDGNPVPNERYEVTDSAGKVKRGALSQEGLAHVTGISPGQCQITFPHLDQSVWRRA